MSMYPFPTTTKNIKIALKNIRRSDIKKYAYTVELCNFIPFEISLKYTCPFKVNINLLYRINFSLNKLLKLLKNFLVIVYTYKQMY